MARPFLSLVSRTAFLVIAPLVGALPAARAATYTVQNLNDSGPGSLRAAITSANASPSADVVEASARTGTIKLLSALPLLRGVLTIKGPVGNSLVVQRSAQAAFNLFAVAKGASVRVSGLTLTGGGGGLETGGAISNEGSLVLANCTLTGNSARRGGALFSTGATSIDGCTFSVNSGDGGGAINTSAGSLTVSNSTFSGNVSAGDGGAIIVQQTVTSLSGCTFVGNHTARAGYGGAILAYGPFPLSRIALTIANCTFTGNIARQGGALWVSGLRTEIKNATITDNTALAGTGIWSEGDSATATFLGGTILAGNGKSPTTFGNDADAGLAKNTFVSRGYNLVGGGTALSIFSQTGDHVGLSRQQLLLGSLKSNGGPTQTIAPQLSSPAVNSIPTTALLVKTDQRGVARPITKSGDIGAVEADDPPVTSSTLVVNTTSDKGDGVCTVGECTLREAIETANKAAAGGSTELYAITFAPQVFSTPQVITVSWPGIVARGKMNIIGPGADKLAISQGNGIDHILGNAGSLQVSGITISGGRAFQGNGGGIYNTGDFGMSDCIVSDNSAEGLAGGGIFNLGNISLLRCTVTNNTVLNYSSAPKTYTGGAGIYSWGYLYIKDSTISNNSGASNGGGICNRGFASIEHSTISGNSATKGGGIFSTASLTISGSTINDNKASSNVYTGGNTGAGIHSNGPLFLWNSTVARNTVKTEGPEVFYNSGGVWANGSTTAILNCTITANNSGSYPAGGVFAISGTTTISNSVIAGNVADVNYGDISTPYDHGMDATIVSGGYNFVGYARSGLFTAPGDQRGGDYPAVDPGLGALAWNGGTVQTIALLPGSPLINAGDPDFDASTLPYDARGVGFPRVKGERIDIGAFEANIPKSSTLVVNTTSDAGDGTCDATECTFREALDTANAAAASGETQTYTITFDPIVFSTPQSIGVAQLPSRDDRLGFIAKGNMKIIGPGADLLTIQLGQFNGLSPRLLNTEGSVSISGITFRGGNPYRGRGGAILNSGTLDLSECVFKNNLAEGGAGGAILNTGTLSLHACRVTENSIRTYGLDSSGTGLEKSFGGGGIYNRGTLYIEDSTISNNTASLNCLGGGIYNEGTATIENTTIDGNSTGAKGGGICSRSTDFLAVFDSTISNNSASNTSSSAGSSYGTGGGIHCDGPLELLNSTVVGNSVDNDAHTSGGGLWTSGPTALINNCTITANNSRSYPAGGLYVYGGVATVTSSVIAANVNNTIYPEVAVNSGAGSIVSGGYNFVGFGSYFNAPGDRAGGYDQSTGQLVVLDPRLGQLANNGGTVQTIAPLPDSPLINVGDPNITRLLYDERGRGFPRVVGGRLDIGAFETSTLATVAKPSVKAVPSRGSAGRS